jgi:hypothetical protein
MGYPTGTAASATSRISRASGSRDLARSSTHVQPPRRSDRLSSRVMPRVIPAVRVDPVVLRHAEPRLVRIGYTAGVLLLAIGSLATPARAADPSASTPPAATDAGGTRWGPILGACVGVLFGGALALWQIRAMKSRRRD